MKGLIPFTLIVSVLHFFEDAALIILGRYTEINIFMLFIMCNQSIFICVSQHNLFEK